MAKNDFNGRMRQLVDDLVGNGLTLDQARREFEKQFITSSLRCNDYNMCRAAKSLGVHRNTLRNKFSSLGIEVETLRRADRLLP